MIFEAMAGHSQFKNIMYKKGAQDLKRAKVFAKLSREITVAAKLGSDDPSSNPRLRSALIAARTANMPRDNIDRALKKADPKDDNLEDIRYEGYGPFGVAFIVETLTNNRNRTASDIRSIFTKFGGNLGETGSVSFLFEHIGLFAFEGVDFDRLFEVALDIGAKDVTQDEDLRINVTCSLESFSKVRDELFRRNFEPILAQMVWNPLTFASSADAGIEKMIDALDDHDDVQAVYTNKS